MDAFAVSIAKGMTISRQRRKFALLLGGFFGGFQMLMPAIGWLVGLSFKDVIMGVDHWIAFGLLAFIGLKMIYDSLGKEKIQKDEQLKLHSILILAVATSIDALMVGLSFAFLNTSNPRTNTSHRTDNIHAFSYRILFRLRFRACLWKQNQDCWRINPNSNRTKNSS